MISLQVVKLTEYFTTNMEKVKHIKHKYYTFFVLYSINELIA